MIISDKGVISKSRQRLLEIIILPRRIDYDKRATGACCMRMNENSFTERYLFVYVH
jgi:hypothetical protein